MKPASYLNRALCVAAFWTLIGCGVSGIPRPPSLNLPQPVTDLRALRKGDKVFLAWTVPVETTDGVRIRHLGTTRICRSSDAASSDCGSPVGTMSPPPSALAGQNRSPALTTKSQASYIDQLPPSLLHDDPAAEVFYTVSVLNQSERSGGLSNQVAVAAVIALPPPSDFRAQVTADGVLLSWTGNPQSPETQQLHHLYRVYRREPGTKTDTTVGEMPLGILRTYLLLDHTFEWEKTYEYRATVVALIHAEGQPETQFEGDDTPWVRVFAHDIFPPAVPSGLQAAFSGAGQQPFIDLIWAPDTDIDLAGYNIYRHEAGTVEQKINPELVKSPAFRDMNVTPGHTYFYSVSAIDVRGNESAHSAEASESVP
ncbi:MAG TPA: fibronectin type III domain-containing protein [Terriglobales bacterium]|nr:fibronectin type III domain-containing protein [Terriglobales bacterium]